MIYIASDHGGYNLKTEFVKYFSDNGIQFEDVGPYELVQDDDYVDYVLPLVQRVRADENAKGILLCRNGVGVSMLANKFKGVRATLSDKPVHAKSSRNDDNTNVLAIPSDYVDSATALEILKTWLTTEFSNDERHVRRLYKVAQYGQE
jgi:ribose 5-phosphate isomerase B